MLQLKFEMFNNILQHVTSVFNNTILLRAGAWLVRGLFLYLKCFNKNVVTHYCLFVFCCNACRLKVSVSKLNSLVKEIQTDQGDFCCQKLHSILGMHIYLVWMIELCVSVWNAAQTEQVVQGQGSSHPGVGSQSLLWQTVSRSVYHKALSWHGNFETLNVKS